MNFHRRQRGFNRWLMSCRLWPFAMVKPFGSIWKWIWFSQDRPASCNRLWNATPI